MTLICQTLLVLLCAASLEAQTGFQDLDVTTSNFAAPGYYLLAPNARDSIGLMDHSGKTVIRKKSGIVSTLQAYSNKYITYFVVDPLTNKRYFIRRDHNLRVVDTLTLLGSHILDFHEGGMWTDSTYMVLGIERRTINMSVLHPGGRPDATVEGAVLQERTFDGRLVFEWKSFDHIPITDATEDIDLTQSLIDYIHVNSIRPSLDGNILISCRHLDEVIKIDKFTGAVMWRLGGSSSKGNEFAFENDTYNGFTGFSHQHTAWETPRGTILLFDNGNLKPQPSSSRAVEYDLDVEQHVARKVWEHIPNQQTISASMGSVQELDNGNVLIGYGTLRDGSTPGSLVAEEVTKSGRVAVSLKNTASSEVVSYRVVKSTFGMSACNIEVVTPTTINLDCDDSTTYITLQVDSVIRPTLIAVERHSYQPHWASFNGQTYCGILPLRWVVRVQDTTALAGSLRFGVHLMSIVEDPDRIKLLYRPIEGQGAFIALDGSYNAQQRQFVIKRVMSGEFMLAYLDCLEPSPASPVNASVEIPVATTIIWKGAAINDGYDVEISTTPQFVAPLRFTTRRVDTTIKGQQDATTYYWRVRRIYKGYERGPWSETYRYTTQLAIPEPIYPKVQRDTVAISPKVVFRWSKTSGADRYRVTVSDVELQQPIVDVVTAADSLALQEELMSNMRYHWVVRSIKGTTTGRPSAGQFFVTTVAAPRLVSPSNDTLVPHVTNQYFSWQPVAGAKQYVVMVKRRTTGAVVAKDTMPGLWAVLGNIPIKTELAWTVQAIGRYGPGRTSAEFYFNTYSTTPLRAPQTTTPKNIDNIDTTQDVILRWTAVNDAASYHVQITSALEFREFVADTVVDKPEFNVGPLASATTYAWRVMALSDYVVSPWSDTARFITARDNSTALTPLWPAIASIDVPTRGTVRYTTLDKFIRYDVQFSRSSAFQDVDLTFASTISSVEYSQLLEHTRYYWRVIGVREDGTTQTGPLSTFTTVYETVGVNPRTRSSLATIETTPTGLSVTAQEVGLTYRVCNLLGQNIVTDSLAPFQRTHVSLDIRGPVFVIIVPDDGTSSPITYSVLLR